MHFGSGASLWANAAAPETGALRLLRLAGLTVVVWLAARAGAWSVEVRWNTNLGQTMVEVTGLTEEALRELRAANWQAEHWQQLFAVYAGRSDSLREMPPMLGKYLVANDCIRFELGFPVEPGVTYRAVFHPSRLLAMTNDGGSEVLSTVSLP